MKSRAMIARMLSLVLFSAFTVSSGFPAEDAGKILKKIQKKYESWNDAKITFTQLVRFAVTKTEQSFRGKLSVKKGSMYRLDFEGRLIVTNGKDVWTVNEPNKQVIIDKYRDDPRSLSPEKILVSVPKDYTAAVLNREEKEGGVNLVLKLVPKDGRSSFKSLKMWVDEDRYTVEKIQVIDLSGNVQTYTITNLEIDTGMKESEFSYEPPSGYEIIDLR